MNEMSSTKSVLEMFNISQQEKSLKDSQFDVYLKVHKIQSAARHVSPVFQAQASCTFEGSAAQSEIQFVDIDSNVNFSKKTKFPATLYLPQLNLESKLKYFEIFDGPERGDSAKLNTELKQGQLPGIDHLSSFKNNLLCGDGNMLYVGSMCSILVYRREILLCKVDLTKFREQRTSINYMTLKEFQGYPVLCVCMDDGLSHIFYVSELESKDCEPVVTLQTGLPAWSIDVYRNVVILGDNTATVNIFYVRNSEWINGSIHLLHNVPTCMILRTYFDLESTPMYVLSGTIHGEVVLSRVTVEDGEFVITDINRKLLPGRVWNVLHVTANDMLQVHDTSHLTGGGPVDLKSIYQDSLIFGKVPQPQHTSHLGFGAHIAKLAVPTINLDGELQEIEHTLEVDENDELIIRQLCYVEDPISGEFSAHPEICVEGIGSCSAQTVATPPPFASIYGDQEPWIPQVIHSYDGEDMKERVLEHIVDDETKRVRILNYECNTFNLARLENDFVLACTESLIYVMRCNGLIVNAYTPKDVFDLGEVETTEEVFWHNRFSIVTHIKDLNLVAVASQSGFIALIRLTKYRGLHAFRHELTLGELREETALNYHGEEETMFVEDIIKGMTYDEGILTVLHNRGLIKKWHIWQDSEYDIKCMAF